MLPVRFIRNPLSLFERDNFLEPLRLAESVLESIEGCGGRMVLDVREEGDRYVVEADLPGFTKDDLDITFEDGVLTLTAESKHETEHKGDAYHVRERHYGRFSRSLRLPRDVNSESIAAVLKDGVLTVTIDKAESAKPHKIAVNTV